MKKIFAVSLGISLLTACVTRDYYVFMKHSGGSKELATVKMSYDYKSSQNPIVDYNTAQSDASLQCRLWGFEAAKITENFSYSCTNEGSGGTCYAYHVVIDYKCLTKQELIEQAENAAKGIGHQELQFTPVE